MASLRLPYLSRTFVLKKLLLPVRISEKEAKQIIRDYYATFNPGLEHVYPEALKGQVEFIYNNLIKEVKLEEYLEQYKALTQQRKKEKGLLPKNS